MNSENHDFFKIFENDPKFREIMRRLFESSLEHSFNGILITTDGPGYPIVYVNDAFCQMTGYGPHEVFGKSPSMLQGPNTDRTVLKRLNDDLENGDIFHGKAINYRKDGSEFMMEWKILPIQNDAGKPSHYLAIQKDVTQEAYRDQDVVDIAPTEKEVDLQ